jgi:hypothetical protein
MLATFLGLTFALSAVFWWFIIAAGTLNAHASPRGCSGARATLSHHPSPD